MSDKRIPPVRVSPITKFVIDQASAEMKISKQEVMERILCKAFPAHADNYRSLKKDK